jgi:hypothetical protein
MHCKPVLPEDHPYIDHLDAGYTVNLPEEHPNIDHLDAGYTVNRSYLKIIHTSITLMLDTL